MVCTVGWANVLFQENNCKQYFSLCEFLVNIENDVESLLYSCKNRSIVKKGDVYMSFELFKIAWKSPREAVQFILKNKFSAYWFVLFLAGFGNVLFGGYDADLKLSPWIFIVGALVLAIPAVVIGSFIAAFFLHFISKWFFGGQGTLKQMTKGMYVTFLPYVILVPFAIIQFIWGLVSDIHPAVSIIFVLIAFAISIVGLVLEIIAISEVEKISIGRAIGAFIVQFIILIILVFIIVFIVTAIALVVFGSF